MPALSDSHDVTDFDTSEARAEMGRDILVSLFVSVVFFEEMEVVSANNDGFAHFVGSYDTSENSTSNTHVSGEGALLINVFSINGLLRGFES